MYGLRSLSQEDRTSSKKMFGAYVRKLYQDDKKIQHDIDNYMQREQKD